MEPLACQLAICGLRFCLSNMSGFQMDCAIVLFMFCEGRTLVFDTAYHGFSRFFTDTLGIDLEAKWRKHEVQNGATGRLLGLFLVILWHPFFKQRLDAFSESKRANPLFGEGGGVPP